MIAVLLAALISGCGTAPKRDTSSKAPPAPRSGGYYLDDGPGDNPPADLAGVPDPVPRAEPLHRGTSRPYVVMGRSYTPMTVLTPYRERGVATWYGRRYHGRMTSSGEIYDMYGMTAAHTVLPIPSYARVTNLQNGRSVVVRINDRGPFVANRLIDLSYTAAFKLGILAGGSALVEVESIVPEGSATTVTAAGTPSTSTDRHAGPVTAAALPDNETQPVTAKPAPAGAPGLSMISPAAAEPLAAAASANPPAADAAGFFLQLGAFGSRDNAETFLARLKAQLDWLAQALHIHTREGLYRVHAGPYASQGEARQMAERVAETLGAKPFVLSR